MLICVCLFVSLHMHAQTDSGAEGAVSEPTETTFLPGPAGHIWGNNKLSLLWKYTEETSEKQINLKTEVCLSVLCFFSQSLQ